MTQKLLRQADTLAASQKAGNAMPKIIVWIAQRAINAQKRCAAWFQKTDSHYEDRSTASPAYYVYVFGTLEKELTG